MTSLDVTFGDTLTFLLLIGALVVMPGVGALRLLGVRAPSPVVALALASSTGLVLCCSVGFLGARVTWWSIPIVLVPLAVIGWIKGQPISDRGPDRGDALIIATIALGLIALSPWWIIAGATTADGLIPVYPYVDQYLHTGTIIEIMRGFPPEQMPHLAGIPFWQYHLFTDLFASTMVALGDLAALPTQGAFVPAFGWAICLLALAALVFTLTESAPLSALAVALFLSPEVSDSFTLDWLQRNTPSQLALPVSLCATLLMFRQLRDRERIGEERRVVREMVLTGGLVAGVFALKAQQFLMIAPALGALGLVLLKDGRLKAVGLSVVTGTIVIAAPLFHHVTHPEPRPLVWKPGAFAGWIANDQLRAWAPDLLESLGAAAGTAVLIVVWFVTGAGLVFSLLALVSLRPLRARVRPAASGIVFAAFALATFLACYGPVEDGTRQFEAWNVGFFTRLLTTPLLCAFAMLGLHSLGSALATRAQLSDRLAALWPAAPLAVMALVAVGRLSSGALDQPVGFPVSWLAATTAIAEHAPDDAVVADVSHLYTGPYLSTFAARRVVVERAIQMGAHYRQVAERVSDLELAWSDPDPQHVRWVFDRYKVTHVIEHKAAPMALPVAKRRGWTLKLDGEVRVWEREVGQRRGVPAGLQTRRVEGTNRHRAVIRVHQRVDMETILRDARTDAATLKRWSALARAPYGPRSPEQLAAPIPAATEDDLPPELRPQPPGEPPQAP